jgi:hypothetical protein
MDSKAKRKRLKIMLVDPQPPLAPREALLQPSARQQHAEVRPLVLNKIHTADDRMRSAALSVPSQFSGRPIK